MTKAQFDKTCCFFKGLKNKCLIRHDGSKTACSLSQSPYSGKVKVCSVTGDRKTCAKMAHLGLLPGQEIELVCSGNRSKCLIKVNGGTISLDHVTAENIMIAPV